MIENSEPTLEKKSQEQAFIAKLWKPWQTIKSFLVPSTSPPEASPPKDLIKRESPIIITRPYVKPEPYYDGVPDNFWTEIVHYPYTVSSAVLNDPGLIGQNLRADIKAHAQRRKAYLKQRKGC